MNKINPNHWGLDSRSYSWTQRLIQQWTSGENNNACPRWDNRRSDGRSPPRSVSGPGQCAMQHGAGDAAAHDVQRCLVGYRSGGQVNPINVFVIHKVLTHSGYMRLHIVLHLRSAHWFLTWGSVTSPVILNIYLFWLAWVETPSST